MCMIVEKVEHISNDKEVWAVRKVVHGMSGNRYYSPFEGYRFFKDVEMEADYDDDNPKIPLLCGNEIEAGYFHVFETEELAYNFNIQIKRFCTVFNEKPIKHIIPANTTIGYGCISKDCVGAGMPCIVTPKLILIGE